MENSIKQSHYIKFFTLACILLMISCGPSNETADNAKSMMALSTTPCSMNYASEDSINLNDHVWDTAVAVPEISHFTLYVGSSASSTLPLLADSISRNAFCLLKDSADKMHQSDTSCNHYITALKLTLGLDVGLSKVQLLFQPAYLCLVNKTGNSGSYQLKGISTTYYMYDASTESFSVSTDTASKQRYIDNILIEHKRGEAKSAFRQPVAGNDTLGDVISVIYSFQEIISLINDNANTAYVKVWNAIQDKYIPSVGYYLQKHTLILGPSQLNVPIKPFTPVGSGIFSNKFANFAHLCPPSCNGLTFKLK